VIQTHMLLTHDLSHV